MRFGATRWGYYNSPVVARKKVPSLAVNKGAHEATTEDEKGYVEELGRFAQFEGGDFYRVGRIRKAVRIRKVRDP